MQDLISQQMQTITLSQLLDFLTREDVLPFVRIGEGESATGQMYFLYIEDMRSEQDAKNLKAFLTESLKCFINVKIYNFGRVSLFLERA